MKISLRGLLAITLLAVLCVSSFNKLHRSNSLQATNEVLTANIEEVGQKTRFYEKRKKLYVNASEAFRLRKQQLSDSPEFFEPVAKVHGLVGTQFPDMIHVLSSYRDRDRGQFQLWLHEKLRVWIPESREYELALGFHPQRSHRTIPTEMRSSYYFNPKRQFTLPLKAGESLIEIDLRPDANSNSELTIKVDGVEVHAASRKMVVSIMEMLRGHEYDKVSSIASSKRSIFGPEGVVLASANLWPTRDEPEGLSVVIREVAVEE